MADEETTTTDRLVKRLKNHKAVAVLLVSFAVLVAVDQAFNILERLWRVTPSWLKPDSSPASADSCVFLIFEQLEGDDVNDLKVEVEVDKSRYRPAFSQRLGDLVAVVDEIKSGQSFDVAISMYRGDDERIRRVHEDVVVDLAAPYHSVVRRLDTATTHTLDISPVTVEYFRRFVSRADFAATPQCSPIPGVRWWSESSQPVQRATH